jgi:riboflavin kinase/FMN adenylyltransferase
LDTYHEFKPGLLKHSSLALGFFDGVHPGHKAVIKKAVDEAHRIGVPAALVTFKEHPRSLTLGKSPPLLTLIEQRLELFAELKVDATMVLTFSEEICKLSPRQYVETVLVSALGARSISVGYNHHFGRNREGDPELLRQLGGEFSFVVHVASSVLIDGIEVSSSRIREALDHRDVALAQQLLSRPYSIVSKVGRGDERGRALGFPTANMEISGRQILPARGVYAGIARLGDGRALASVINLGFRPTVTSGQQYTFEVHILDFNEDIYDQPLTVEFLHLVRDEMKFGSVAELKAQIAEDCLTARKLLSLDCGYQTSERTLRA